MVTKQEISEIMDILKIAYPKYYNNISKEDVLKTVNLWCEMFNDTDLITLALAVKSLISHLEFPPTIADIRKEIQKLNSENTLSIDYWNEAYDMICNGLYMTPEQFDSCSEIFKRYFGDLKRLREKSKTENLNLEVEQSLFNKTSEVIIQRKKEDNLIPKDIKNKLNEMNIKMLERG